MREAIERDPGFRESRKDASPHCSSLTRLLGQLFRGKHFKLRVEVRRWHIHPPLSTVPDLQGLPHP